MIATGECPRLSANNQQLNPTAAIQSYGLLHIRPHSTDRFINPQYRRAGACSRRNLNRHQQNILQHINTD